MTEEEKVPVKRKPSKEEKNEAAQIVLRLQESGDYSRYALLLRRVMITTIHMCPDFQLL